MTGPARDASGKAKEFGVALTSLVRVIEATVARRDTDGSFELIVALDEALTAVPDFGRSLGPLLAAGQPGEVVEEDLRRLTETLGHHTAELAAHRRRLTELSARRQAIREKAAEAEQVSGEIVELGRLERLASSLERLRAERRAIEERSHTAISAAHLAESELEATVEKALQMDELMVDDLRAQVSEKRDRLAECTAERRRRRDELSSADSALARENAELERLTTQIRASRVQQEEVCGKIADLRVTWEAHLAADKEIAAIVLRTEETPRPPSEETTAQGSEADAVAQIAAHVEGHLRQLDEILRTALAESETQEGHDHRRRRFGSAVHQRRPGESS